MDPAVVDLNRDLWRCLSGGEAGLRVVPRPNRIVVDGTGWRLDDLPHLEVAQAGVRRDVITLGCDGPRLDLLAKDLHRPLALQDDLDGSFALRIERTVTNSLTVHPLGCHQHINERTDGI
jgi:hypothetical protein